MIETAIYTFGEDVADETDDGVDDSHHRERITNPGIVLIVLVESTLCHLIADAVPHLRHMSIQQYVTI